VFLSNRNYTPQDDFRIEPMGLGCTGSYRLTPFGKCERIEATASRLNGVKLPKMNSGFPMGFTCQPALETRSVGSRKFQKGVAGVVPKIGIPKPINESNIIQCEAPKIAKLVYNSNNYGVWYL